MRYFQLPPVCRETVRHPYVLGIALIALLAAAACGASNDDPNRLAGSIEIDGSSTVFPISEAMAEKFHLDERGVQVNVGVSGTGGGFKRFTVGDTDISDASRPIKEAEAQAAADNGINYFEMRVGIDGLAVITHLDNDFVDCLTTDDLNLIWAPESAVDSWRDVRPDWPDERIRLYGPGTDSGTFDFFTEEINAESGASRPDFTASEDDNVLVQGIAGDRAGLGYFGYAFYAQNTNKLKILAVDAGDGCVTPDAGTIESGEYFLARPLFIYVNKASLERPEVAAFVEFYMQNAKLLVEEVGYVPFSSDFYAEELLLVQQ